jgi:hypothetical protein
MSPLLSRQPVPWDLDARFMNGTRLGLAALAGFSFAVTFVAGSRTSHPPQRGLPPTPVAERAIDFGPDLASRFEPIRTLPDLLPAHTVAPPVTVPRSRPTRPVTATPRAPTSASAVAPPPVSHPPRRRIVQQPRTPVAPRPSKPAPAPQTFDSSGNTFDSSG